MFFDIEKIGKVKLCVYKNAFKVHKKKPLAFPNLESTLLICFRVFFVCGFLF